MSINEHRLRALFSMRCFPSGSKRTWHTEPLRTGRWPLFGTGSGKLLSDARRRLRVNSLSGQRRWVTWCNHQGQRNGGGAQTTVEKLKHRDITGSPSLSVLEAHRPPHSARPFLRYPSGRNTSSQCLCRFFRHSYSPWSQEAGWHYLMV